MMGEWLRKNQSLLAMTAAAAGAGVLYHLLARRAAPSPDLQLSSPVNNSSTTTTESGEADSGSAKCLSKRKRVSKGPAGGGSKPSEVIAAKLWLGNRHHARNVALLQQLGITHVLNVTQEHEVECAVESGIEYLRISAKDSNAYPLDAHFDEVEAFLQRADRVLVHCHSGHSRSAALVLLFLIRQQRIGCEQALELLLQVHPGAKPNKGFVALLQHEGLKWTDNQ